MIAVPFIRRLLAATLLAAFAFPTAPARATMPPIEGVVPAEVAEAFEAGLFSLPPRARSALRSSSVQTQWTLPVLLVSFADDTLTYGAQDIEPLLFDLTGRIPTGSLADYWQWASRGRVQITGRVVARVRVSGDRFYYARDNRGVTANGTPHNSYGFVRDALYLCESAVNWNEFDRDRDGYVDMLWVVHAGVGGEAGDRNRLLSLTSRMSSGWSQGNPFVTSVEIPGSSGRMMRLDRFTILPEVSPFRPGALSEIGVFAHEFGHALGLPDLYDTSNQANSGPGNWSLMSSGAYGGDGHSPEYPTHIGAWATQYLGWDQTHRPSRDTVLTLGPIEDSGNIVDLWFQGEENAEHFLLENRQRSGFDRNLPAGGLIIYHVDEAVIGQRLHQNTINSGPTPGLRVVEADGDEDLVNGQNRGDGSDPFPGGLNRTYVNDYTFPSLRSFTGATTNVTLAAIREVAEGIQFTAHVRAPGWLAAEDHTGAQFAPYPTARAARNADADGAGRCYMVMNEVVQGRQQVLLRSSENWDAATQLSASPGQAQDPTMAVLPGGDLAVAWSDTRDGAARIYYRSRIRGAWTPERILVSLPGSCRSPALGADARGGISLVFQYVLGDSVEVRFLRFPYTSPFGMPQRVAKAGSRPENPSVIVEADGATYVLWQERTPPQQLWFSRFHPDSGLRAAQPLTLPTIYPQGNYSAAVDAAGALHVMWQTTGQGSGEIRYQRRLGFGLPNPIDLVVESAGSGVQNPRIAIDAESRLHLVFEESTPFGPAVRYRSNAPGFGWDVASTDLMHPRPAGGSRPVVLPSRGGNVTVAYIGSEAGSLRFIVRRRDLVHSYITGAPPPPTVAEVSLAAGPNPLRSGRVLTLWSDGPGPVDVFDLSGRRVSSVELRASGGAWRGQVDAGATARWPTGVYFVRSRESGGRALSVVVMR